MNFKATKQKVNGSAPPDGFLSELVGWGKIAPVEIFIPSNGSGVYASVFKALGPYKNISYSRAAMLEVMRVLAGFESSWHWNEGRDKNTSIHKPQREWEAGAWQVSMNSTALASDLESLVRRKIGPKTGPLDAEKFQAAMKQDHQLAMEYIARLLRHTVRANGPVLRHEIDHFLHKDAVKEFESLVDPLHVA